ncbi:MAG: hypothetical protein K8T20_13565 [Planctomycetes bacterium]|nr:hypothetical protein [Planctomycetota bacterium]
MDQIKMRYMSGGAFSTHVEAKRLFLIAMIVLTGIAVFFEVKRRKAQDAQEIQADLEKWEKLQAAIKAGPQPGAGVEGGNIKWDNMLAEEQDDSSLDDVVNDRGFKYLVRHIANLKPGEGLKPEERFDYAELLTNPALHRGNVVSLSGIVNKEFWNIKLESNQGAYTDVHRLYLVDLSGTQGCIVDVLERPDGIGERTSVETDAVFIKTHKYETQDTKNSKGQVVRVPYFLAQRVTKIKRGPGQSIWTPMVTAGVIGACVVLVVAIFLMGRSGGQKRKNSEVTSNAL